MIKSVIFVDLPSVEIEKKWNYFVNNHFNGNYFQTPAYFKSLLNQKKVRPFAIILLNKDEKIVGLLVGAIQSFGPKFLSYILSRTIIYGGPLILDSNKKEILICLLNELELFSSIYIEFRNLFGLNELKTFFSNAGYLYEEHLNFIIKIDELTIKRIKEDKTRQIKKALKNGAVIEEARNIEQINKLYDILKLLYKIKVKKPLPSLEYFQNIFLKSYQEHPTKVFLVLFEEQIIGGIFCLTYNNEVIYEYYICGLDTDYKELYPSVLATYAPIKYAIDNGFKCFDFLGAGKPSQDYGVRNFKSRFGGEEVNYGRFTKIKSLIYYFYKTFFYLYAKKNKS